MTLNTLQGSENLPRDQWLQKRRGGIGGSDVAALVGLSRYKSAIDVWLEKTGQVKSDDNPSEAAYWGTVLEAVVADEFAKQTGYVLQRCGSILVHPERNYMLANVDRIIVGKEGDPGNGILEIKTTGEYSKDGWSDGDNLPFAPVLQLQHYLAVTGYKWGCIAVLIGGNKYRHYRLDRDDALIDRLYQLEEQFWQHVLDETLPEIDGSEATANTLADMYPDVNDESIDLSKEANEWIEKYHRAKEAIDRHTADKRLAENRLKQMLGEHARGWTGTHRIKWTPVTTERLDTKRLQEEQPEICQQYIKPSTYRRFEIKEAM